MKNFLIIVWTLIQHILRSAFWAALLSGVFWVIKWLLSLLSITSKPTLVNFLGGGAALFVLLFLHRMFWIVRDMIRRKKDPVYDQMANATGISYKDYMEIRKKRESKTPPETEDVPPNRTPSTAQERMISESVKTETLSNSTITDKLLDLKRMVTGRLTISDKVVEQVIDMYNYLFDNGHIGEPASRKIKGKITHVRNNEKIERGVKVTHDSKSLMEIVDIMFHEHTRYLLSRSPMIQEAARQAVNDILNNNSKKQ